MNNKIWIVVVIIAIIAVAGYLVYSSGPSVSAQGVASIKVVPDQVSVNINIETRNSTAVAAQEINKEISDELLTQLIKLGFNRNDLQFVNFNSYPEYTWDNGQQNFKDFVVTQQLVVKTNNTNEVPSVVDAAINSGALISYIDFEVSDGKQKEIKAQALEEASKDAMAKAQAIAQGQGKKLGRLVSLQNQDYNYPGPIMYYAMKEGTTAGMAASDARVAAVNLQPQEQDITASINAIYKLGLF